jgi:methionyl-tRNA formyltransferase
MSESPQRYLVAGCHSWCRTVFDGVLRQYPGEWHFMSSSGEMNPAAVAALDPRYIFFLHWSWKVPDSLIAERECVCFHMTDVPFGRGGSPLQNLIARGIRHTRLSALRMTAEIDAGPVYCKRDLCLEGGAEEIYFRANLTAAELIREIVIQRMEPSPQSGEVVAFKRRRSSESRIPHVHGLPGLHDFIRMLDAEHYPHAFLEEAGFRFEFRRSALYDGRIHADVIITEVKP